MPGVVSFGIGCFHFAVKGTLPLTFNGSEYIAELHRVLESAPNIDNLEIDYDPWFADYSVVLTEDPPRISEGTGRFPSSIDLRIRFHIYLPRRVQRELVQWRRVEDGDRERFRVTILQGFQMPVAFVETVSEGPVSSPADGVMLVREFIKQQVEKYSSELLLFEFLGPSPFHADCYLGPHAASDEITYDWEFNRERESASGYDTLFFHFNPDVFDDLQEAKRGLFNALLDEASFFYDIQHTTIARERMWREIAELLAGVVSLHRKEGLKGIFGRLFRSSRKAREVLLRAVDFESKVMFRDTGIREARANIYRGSAQRLMADYVYRAIDDLGEYPTEQAMRLVDLLEAGRVKSVEIIVVLASVVLGTALGAFLTWCISR